MTLSRGMLVPKTVPVFEQATIIVFDGAEPDYGDRLRTTLNDIGFSSVIVYGSMAELEEYGDAIGTDILLINPHCFPLDENGLIATLATKFQRRKPQLVLLSDERPLRGGLTRITKRAALDPEALRRCMEGMRRTWEQRQPRRMGGPHDDEFDREHRRA